MGVMTCSRNGCSNIMCDTYLPNLGYICNECQREFKELPESSELNNTKDIAIRIEQFMKTEKNLSSAQENKEMSVDEFFRQYTSQLKNKTLIILSNNQQKQRTQLVRLYVIAEVS